MRDNYRPDIEGLRCIAVLSVIFFHAGYSSFVSGFVGVDVFFVISGFLITSGIYNGISQGNFSVIDFFNRRFWRIQPLLLVLMLATTCYWYFNATPDDIIKFLASLKSLSLFSSNQYFGSLDFGYFSDNTDIMPLLHTWSLSIEWQWYFLLPFILVLLANDFGRRALPWVMLAGLLLMTYLGLRPSGEDDAVRYYSFSMRVFALIAGALVATIDIKTIANKIPYWLNTLLSLSFLSLLIHMSQTKKAIPAYPNLYGLIAVSMTVLLIILGSSERKTAIFKVMAFKPFVLIGLLSYSLYIWHWPIFAAYRYKSVYMSASTVVLLLLASLLAAVLSYKLLENPMRKLYKKVPLTITLIILVFVPITFAHLLDSKVMANSIAKNPNDAIQIEWRNKNAQIADCQDPDDLSEEYLAQCAFGTAGKKNSVLVIGDSWSDHFVLMVDHILKDAGRAGYHLTTSNDSPFLDDRGIAGKGPINQINFAAIKANQYDYVVIGNSLSRDYKHNKAIKSGKMISKKTVTHKQAKQISAKVSCKN
ncbi:MAG: acyltransferase [Deferribacteraceae bacterium]|jgi:peptidoglycan/LPS O-acetylase OafA/YrhL|nr:acyltransferase [Deferribacteraceae bacterium]